MVASNLVAQVDSGAGPYGVKLELFEGPLDLLLFLIRKNEIDIYDIPIADIIFGTIRPVCAIFPGCKGHLRRINISTMVFFR